MASRTTQTVVCFSSTFGLPDVDAPQPPGSDRVDHDEESIESVSRLAWRRIFHPPAWDRPAWGDASEGTDQSRGNRDIRKPNSEKAGPKPEGSTTWMKGLKYERRGQ
jgi:hypothetical protein